MTTPATRSRHALAPAHLARLLAGWRGRGPAYEALAARLRLLVLDGRVPLGVRLPAERELAAALGVSRTTVTAAYDRLRLDRFLDSRRGAGSWTRLPSGPAAPSRDGPLLPGADDALLDLAAAAPAAPTGALHAAAEAAVAELPRYLPTHGYEPLGLPALRAAIADRYTARGAPTDPGQVLVTSGAQHAFALVLRTLVRPGDRVAMDDPSYPNAIQAARDAGARLVPVPLDGDGWDLDMWAGTLRGVRPRLAHVLADYHNPTGLLLDTAGRDRLLHDARRAAVPLVVDETLAELRLDGPPTPAPLAALDTGGTTLSIGSTSKTFWGGLRVGWVRAAPRVLDRLVAARAGLDLGTPVLEQLVAARLLADGEPLLARRRAELRAGRDTLLAALGAHLPAWSVRVPPGGLVLWARLPVPAGTALAVAAARHGVRLAAGPRFGVAAHHERFVRLPCTLPGAATDEAVRRIAAAWAEVAEVAVGSESDAAEVWPVA